MKPRARLWNLGFLSLLTTQFFEAASDNLVKGAIGFAIATSAPWEPVFGEGGNGIVAIDDHWLHRKRGVGPVKAVAQQRDDRVGGAGAMRVVRRRSAMLVAMVVAPAA